MIKKRTSEYAPVEQHYRSFRKGEGYNIQHLDGPLTLHLVNDSIMVDFHVIHSHLQQNRN